MTELGKELFVKKWSLVSVEVLLLSVVYGAP